MSDFPRCPGVSVGQTTSSGEVDFQRAQGRKGAQGRFEGREGIALTDEATVGMVLSFQKGQLCDPRPGHDMLQPLRPWGAGLSRL